MRKVFILTEEESAYSTMGLKIITEDQSTITYYEENAKSFIEDTWNAEVTEIRDAFLELLPEQAVILDFGCGSGRDTKYFLERGYIVEAIDGSLELCKAAGRSTGIKVKHMYFHELDAREQYDGIWACASILHLKRQELPEMIQKMSRALKQNGILYLSFKYGDFEGERRGRYFTDMTEERLSGVLTGIPELNVEKQWITNDGRVGRGDERWLNTILRK